MSKANIVPISDQPASQEENPNRLSFTLEEMLKEFENGAVPRSKFWRELITALYETANHVITGVTSVADIRPDNIGNIPLLPKDIDAPAMVRMDGADANTRQTNQDVFGRSLFYGDACKVVHQYGAYYEVLAGEAYVAGIRFFYPGMQELLIEDGNLPTKVWLNVFWPSDPMVERKPIIQVGISNSDEVHYSVIIATIDEYKINHDNRVINNQILVSRNINKISIDSSKENKLNIDTKGIYYISGDYRFSGKGHINTFLEIIISCKAVIIFKDFKCYGSYKCAEVLKVSSNSITREPSLIFNNCIIEECQRKREDNGGSCVRVYGNWSSVTVIDSDVGKANLEKGAGELGVQGVAAFSIGSQLDFYTKRVDLIRSNFYEVISLDPDFQYDMDGFSYLTPSTDTSEVLTSLSVKECTFTNNWGRAIKSQAKSSAISSCDFNIYETSSHNTIREAMVFQAGGGNVKCCNFNFGENKSTFGGLIASTYRDNIVNQPTRVSDIIINNTIPIPYIVSTFGADQDKSGVNTPISIKNALFNCCNNICRAHVSSISNFIPYVEIKSCSGIVKESVIRATNGVNINAELKGVVNTEGEVPIYYADSLSNVKVISVISCYGLENIGSDSQIKANITSGGVRSGVIKIPIYFSIENGSTHSINLSVNGFLTQFDLLDRTSSKFSSSGYSANNSTISIYIGNDVIFSQTPSEGEEGKVTIWTQNNVLKINNQVGVILRMSFFAKTFI